MEAVVAHFKKADLSASVLGSDSGFVAFSNVFKNKTVAVSG